MSFFRYPGGKAKLSGVILDKARELTEDKKVTTYIEPFFGGGAVCFKALQGNVFPDLRKIYANDIDFALFCLWASVMKEHEKLIEKVIEFQPTVESFYEFKEVLTTQLYSGLSKLDIGFMKLALHQMSYSGLGVKAGGPIGGKKQSSNYGVDCRWSTASMVKKITKNHELLKKYNTRFWCADFDTAMISILPFCTVDVKPFVYLDPPYFIKGNDLYAHSFGEDEHIKLADRLKNFKATWLLSYDDCPEVRELYSWATIEEVNVNYTIRTARAKNELLIHA